MSTITMSFALPEALRSYVNQRVASGHYGNTSEYIRELIRRDQEDQTKKRLWVLIEEGSAALAEKMFDAALDGLSSFERRPRMGSPRLGQLCSIPGLRAWRFEGFAMMWLYFEADDHLNVVRLLGERQDILAILRTAE